MRHYTPHFHTAQYPEGFPVQRIDGQWRPIPGALGEVAYEDVDPDKMASKEAYHRERNAARLRELNEPLRVTVERPIPATGLPPTALVVIGIAALFLFNR